MINTHDDTAAIFEVKDVELLRGSARRCVDDFDIAVAGDDDICGLVLVTVGMTA
jgi:hypothetical protein